MSLFDELQWEVIKNPKSTYSALKVRQEQKESEEDEEKDLNRNGRSYVRKRNKNYQKKNIINEELKNGTIGIKSDMQKNN